MEAFVSSARAQLEGSHDGRFVRLAQLLAKLGAPRECCYGLGVREKGGGEMGKDTTGDVWDESLPFLV